MPLGFRTDDEPSTKCYFANGSLPKFVDSNQLPKGKRPFSAIFGRPFNHTVELICPEEVHEEFLVALRSKVKQIHYSRVIMPLSALLEGAFLNAYIKTGNILMISEGHSRNDNAFSLCDGVVKLYLDKGTYERAGLVGSPQNRAKTRWLVEINLRLPSMLHGKKGFERVKWAFSKVLDISVSWLFCDLRADSQGGPIASHHADQLDATFVETKTASLHVPSLNELQSAKNLSSDTTDDFAITVYEWLCLAAIDSPRLHAADTIDPFLSRYKIPRSDGTHATSLIKFTWRGLIPATWIARLLTVCISTVRSSSVNNAWFALSVYGFPNGCRQSPASMTLLRPPIPAAVKQDSFCLWELGDA